MNTDTLSDAAGARHCYVAEMNLPHAPSLYVASADPAPAFPRLRENVRADVAIIGGGYTGLSAALHLAEAGISAVVVEANSVGWGASGRNGGQLHTGQRRDQDWLEQKLGRDEARALWRLAEEAKALTLGLITRHRIDCDWRAGLIETVHKARLVSDERAYADRLRRDYGYDLVEWLDRDQAAQLRVRGEEHRPLRAAPEHAHHPKPADGLVGPDRRDGWGVRPRWRVHVGWDDRLPRA